MSWKHRIWCQLGVTLDSVPDGFSVCGMVVLASAVVSVLEKIGASAASIMRSKIKGVPFPFSSLILG